MKNCLLVSNKSLLNDLYSVNLGVYIDAKVEICDSINSFEKLSNKQFQEYDIIISVSNMAGVDCSMQLYDKLKEFSIDTPLIVIGKKTQLRPTKQVTILEGNLNIPQLIKKCASLLGVTAQQMVDAVSDEYYPVSYRVIQLFEFSPCDLRIKVTKEVSVAEYALCVKKDESIKEKLDSYLEEGVSIFYIPTNLRLEVVNRASKYAINHLNAVSCSKPAKKLAAIEQGFDVVAGLLGENPEVSAEVVAISKKCVESVKTVTKDFPRLKGLLTSMVSNKSGYLYLHSVMGTYVSKHIIDNISWGSEEHADKLSFVFFFHDMFLSPLFMKYPNMEFEEELIFNDELEDKDKEIIINHARLAAEMVKKFPRCPLGADAIILQHHGTTNGMGFTMDYKDDISPLAKVMIVSEAFVDQLVHAKNNGDTPPDIMKITSLLREKFRKHTYKKIVQSLESITF